MCCSVNAAESLPQNYWGRVCERVSGLERRALAFG